MHAAGGTHTQGRPASTGRLTAYWIRLPQEAWGVRMPTPRKLRLDSDRMARPARRGKAHHTGEITLGSTLRRRIRPVRPPRARAARTYSCSRTERVLPYTSR